MVSKLLMLALPLLAILAQQSQPVAAQEVRSVSDCALAGEQCGGLGWTGPACCPSGSVCTPQLILDTPSVAPDSRGEAGYYGYGDSILAGYGSELSEFSACLPVGGAAPGPADVDTQLLTVAEALEGLAGGKFTSESLVLAYLVQIEKYEPFYNAFTFFNEFAIEEAKASDAKRASGGPIGALEGVPVVIKEALNYFGKPSTFGWKYTSSVTGGVDLFPLKDAAVTARLKDAGAIILGKTNIPAFSLSSWRTDASWDGVTINALNPELAPGGSSAGTATAVAAGFAPWGVAEETGGSIQNPAASQSLVSVKTTFGIVPIEGVTPLAGATRDVLGPIAKTVRDAAIALDVMTGYGTPAFVGKAPVGGYTASLGKKTLEGAVIGLYGPSWAPAAEALSPEVQELYDTAVVELQALGATVVEDPFAGTGFAELKFPQIGYDKRGSESVAYDFYYYARDTLGITGFDEFRDIVGVTPFDEGQPLSTRQVGLPPAEAQIFLDSLKNPSVLPDLGPFDAIKDAYLKILDSVFDKYKLDALVYPQLITMYPELATDDEPVETTVSEINIMGTPGVTVPSTRSDAGPIAPFNLMFTGKLNSEAHLLALAYDYEQASQLRIVAELVS